MPAEMKQLARTMKGTASFTTEADTVTNFYCEEEPTVPVETVASETGLKQVKLNLMEWDNDVLVEVFGGSIAKAQEVTIEGKKYTVDKFKAPRDVVQIEKALRVLTRYNVVIDIPRAKILARFIWNLAADQIAQIEITATAMSSASEEDGAYEIYKLGDPRLTPVEAMAADALLDRRLKINLPAPWLLRIFGRKTVPIRVKLPTAGSLIRMSSLFTRMDIDLQHLHDGNFGSVLEQIAKHGVTTSRIIAYGLLRGTWSARLLNRPLAWYIRQHMPMQGLAELAKIIVLMSTSEAFVSIIASVASLNLMKPTEASQPTETGS